SGGGSVTSGGLPEPRRAAERGGGLIVSFLAAMDRNLVIGDERGIPWHLPADLKRFRRLTLGKPIVMGRTTFPHIGKPLDKRVNIVMSRRAGFRHDGALVG